MKTRNYKTVPTNFIRGAKSKTKLENPVIYQRLKTSISEMGQTTPIHVINTEGNMYELLLGSNILKCIVELGIPDVICYDHGSLSKHEAKLAALRIELIQFPYNDVELSSVLHELAKHFSLEDLYSKLPLTQHKIDTLIRYKTYDWDKETQEEAIKRELRRVKAMTRFLQQKKDKLAKDGVHLYKRIGLNLFQ